jgi:excinuclease ABC subunit C
LVTKEEYGANIKNAIQFLQGKNKEVLKSLREFMQKSSDEQRFEQAAKIRDSIYSIENILEKQTVVNDKEERDQDVVNFFGDERGVTIEVLAVRHGRVLGSRAHFIPQINILADGESEKEWLTSFINQYYEDNYVPDEVIVPIELGEEISFLLQKVLEKRSDKKVRVCHPMNQYLMKLAEMALENAREHFKGHIQGSESKMAGLQEIQKKFKLPEVPKRIECFDISHFQGAETVASQVVYEDGLPNTDQYRRYKLKTIEGVNDFESMKEVLSRRLKHTEYEDPQLILIDGGKGQLNIVSGVLKDLGRIDIPVASIAKARTKRDFEDKEVESTQERFFLPGRSNYITFRETSEAFKILVGLRNEAHRFAITYHRKLRDNSMLESVLDHIPGVGEERKKALLTKFQDVEAIRNANIDEITQLEGFSRKLAETILAHLEETNSLPEIEASEK